MEYVIVVNPATPAFTAPKDVTLATELLVLLQVPPVVPSVRLIVSPEHTVAGPAIAPGIGVTLIVVFPDNGTTEQAVVVMLNKL